jgi:hypothetical protein
MGRFPSLGKCIISCQEVLRSVQTTPEHYVKDQQKISSGAITTKLGSKQVLPCEAENRLAEYCLAGKKGFLTWQWQTACVSLNNLP